MSALARLLERATPGPWCSPHDMGNRALRAEAEGHYTRLATFDLHRGTPFEVDGVANTRLAALAPDMARLLIDMADELRKHSSENEHDYISHPKADALLALFAKLEQRAGDASNA